MLMIKVCLWIQMKHLGKYEYNIGYLTNEVLKNYQNPDKWYGIQKNII